MRQPTMTGTKPKTPKPTPKHDHIVEPLRRFAVKLADLKLDPANARLHSERNIAAIRRSLHTFGQDEAVIFQKATKIVRVGNGRVIAARELVKSGDERWKWIAAIGVDEDDLSAAARAIAHNRTADLAGWDRDVLAATLSAVRDSDVSEATGFTDTEVADLLARVRGSDTTAAATTKSVTFRLANEDHAALLDHLKTFDDDRNVAMASWLASSSGKAARS